MKFVQTFEIKEVLANAFKFSTFYSPAIFFFLGSAGRRTERSSTVFLECSSREVRAGNVLEESVGREGTLDHGERCCR